MATVLDISLLEQFSPILSFLLVFTIVYGVFKFTKVFGDNDGLYAIIAFVMALASGIVPGGDKVIINMAPWVALIMVFLVFMLALIGFVGLSKDDIINMFGGRNAAGWFLIIPLILIMVAALSNVFGQQLLEEGTGAEGGSFSQNVSNALFNSKILGLIIIFTISAFTIRILTESPK